MKHPYRDDRLHPPEGRRDLGPLTFREQAALAALTGLLAGSAGLTPPGQAPDAMAARAVTLADELIAALAVERR